MKKYKYESDTIEVPDSVPVGKILDEHPLLEEDYSIISVIFIEKVDAYTSRYEVVFKRSETE